jgi:hypothetical protein
MHKQTGVLKSPAKFPGQVKTSKKRASAGG